MGFHGRGRERLEELECPAEMGEGGLLVSVEPGVLGEASLGLGRTFCVSVRAHSSGGLGQHLGRGLVDQPEAIAELEQKPVAARVVAGQQFERSAEIPCRSAGCVQRRGTVAGVGESGARDTGKRLDVRADRRAQLDRVR